MNKRNVFAHIHSLRWKLLILVMITAFLLFVVSYVVLNLWHLWEIRSLVDFSICQQIPIEAEAYRCFFHLVIGYLNNSHWVTFLFICLILEASAVGWILKNITRQQWLIWVPAIALIQAIMLWVLFYYTRVAAMAVLIGIPLGAVINVVIKRLLVYCRIGWCWITELLKQTR